MNQHSVKQILIYLAVGLSTALLEFILFELLFHFTHVGVVFSNIIAVIVATLTNFALNGKVTFKNTSNMLRSGILYLLLFIFNMVFSSTAISIAVEYGIPESVIKLTTMVCIVLWNYVLYKKLVFK